METTQTDVAPLNLDLRGIYETHLTVRNLEVSLNFYQQKLGLRLARMLSERRAAFLWVGAPQSGMLGLWESGSAPLGLRLHMAFRSSLQKIETMCQTLRTQDITPLDFDGVSTDEPVVIGWMPAVSIYVKDPDGHSIEFINYLDEAPAPDLGVVPLSIWTKRKPV
ncbi:VOC family protein [Phaeobacter sp.]|uniref:VOC family protein n=1 Tax=Phaeobacter sp. TaxID=1902409 RepID=UPI0025D2E34C|nr:VOC family protein [Phaeobacter sp.]